MIEVNGKTYELKYNMRTIEQIEAVTKESLVASVRKTEGFLSIQELKIYFGFALFNDSGNRVSPQQGMNIAETLIKSEGYMKVNQMVMGAIEKDCPFLFQVD